MGTLAILMVLPWVLPFSVSAQNLPVETYTVQLSQSISPHVLDNVGSNVTHRFAFSQNPIFQNIYSFSSSEPLPQLRADLFGTYNYLDQDQTASEGVVEVNDPGFTTNAADVDKEWGLAKAGFPQAWEKTVGSTKNIVAVIDTGIDATHEDLQTTPFVPGYDFVNNKPISGIINTDDNGHGTLIAGILGAAANNGKGIVGTNWFISLMPIKALDSSGQGDSSTIAEAIVWATDRGAQFINMSLGGIGFGHDTTLSNAISYAFNKNVLIVAAAGNDVAVNGGNMDTNPVFPVCDDNDQNMILGVAATDQNDLKAAFSNYGKACVDVAAPGKRILSTINYDPVTKIYSPNSYAYASGTSLAVPFVVGEAALIHALYPSATNTEIRDRIIASADSIDSLNLTQCGGQSCAGLLGGGRIDVANAIATAPTTTLLDGDLVKASGSDLVYQISGGQKRPVSSFVYNQRFLGTPIKIVPQSEIDTYPTGVYATPLEGTLVKTNNDPTVYIISKGLKLPITGQIFSQRNFSFANVQTVSYSELASWVTGTLLPPVDGTLVKAGNNPTVYWVVGGILHPINYGFYVQRGLNIFPILVVSAGDLSGYAKGEAYIR